MRIEELGSQRIGDRVRIKARYVYEDTDLPPIEVYYEAGPPLADALEATPDAFALTGFPLALWEGERRLKVEGALDTTLANGLGQAGALLASWHERCSSLTLEPVDGFYPVRQRPEPHAAALFSGGVDAMAMLCENRRLVPLDHPLSIRTAMYAFGFSFLDRPDGLEDPRMRARYEAQARRLEALGERIGFTLVRLDTNVRRLDPSREPFHEAAHSAAFLAPLVASPSYVSDALIASVGEGGPVQTPHGSHPLLDVQYGTGAVRVHHMQPQVGRTDKLGMIADWEPAYDTLQVCHGGKDRSSDLTNCGRCEKCVRTMLGLLVWNALPRFSTFPHDNVTPKMIDNIRVRSAYCYLTMNELLAGLQRVDRHDLVRAIQAQVNEGPWARQKRKWRHGLTLLVSASLLGKSATRATQIQSTGTSIAPLVMLLIKSFSSAITHIAPRQRLKKSQRDALSRNAASKTRQLS
jgi:hypothetical protein